MRDHGLLSRTPYPIREARASRDRPAMKTVFGKEYSQAYDLLYREKDYAGECALVKQLFAKYGAREIGTVLDLGCGTGNHGILLAASGLAVTGVDSSVDMLAVAERKARQAGIPLRFHQADLHELDLNKQFDAALLMFAVLGYQTENEDVVRTLQTARRHLRTAGLLIFDVWYGPAVLAEKPGPRFRVEREADKIILRTSTGVLDSLRQCCLVQFRLWEIDAAVGVKETVEEHLMRFFFPQELELFLRVAGFRLRRLGGFPDVDREPDEGTWNVLAVAEAI